MTDESTSTWPPWESLSTTFKESYPSVDPESWKVLGELWSQAVVFGKAHHLDESDVRANLLSALTHIPMARRERIVSLPAYLFTSYKHRVFDLEAKRQRETQLDEINHELAIDVSREMETKVLLEEIVVRMDDSLREIYDHLVLGYSYEEMEKRLGARANVLRSRFSKGLKRIANEIKSGV